MLQPDEPQPEPPRPNPDFAEETWDQFMARQWAQEAMRAAREAGERDREGAGVRHQNHIRLGLGPDGRRRVGIWNINAMRYDIVNED